MQRIIIHLLLFQVMVNSIIDLYEAVRTHLICDVSTPHYTFSLRDVALVIDGLLILSPRSKMKGRSMSKADSSISLSNCKCSN